MIIPGLANSFKLEILLGIHRSDDQYRMALYTQDAVLSEQTTAYLTAGEVVGNGYKAGGRALVGYVATLDGRMAILDWEDPAWPASSITAWGALIYNFSKQNRAVAVLSLGQNYISTNGSFMVELPDPTATTAVVRIG